jgi:uncharacterized protein
MADLIFDSAEAGECTLITSLWNIGEVLGVLDEKRRRNWLSEPDYQAAVRKFASELMRLRRLDALQIVPVSNLIVSAAWNYISDYHLYEADAIQITTCIHNKNDVLVSGDKKLIEISQKAGLQAANVEKDSEKISSLLK